MIFHCTTTAVIYIDLLCKNPINLNYNYNLVKGTLIVIFLLLYPIASWVELLLSSIRLFKLYYIIKFYILVDFTRLTVHRQNLRRL